jgi:hypothetical protein
VIKINKALGYLVGLILVFVIYLIGQFFFLINTVSATGQICDITSKSGSLRRPGRVEFFYACFTTKENTTVKIRAGSNLGYEFGDTITLIYKKNNPYQARINNFYELWVEPCFFYLLPFALIMAIITAAYYESKYVVISRNPFKIWIES